MARARSLTEFQQAFLDEGTCAAFLFERRWPNGFVCPGCGGGRAAALKCRAYTYECLDCSRQTSITAGTAMHRSKLALPTWFWAAHLMATHSNGMSARQLEDQLGVTYKTAWLLAQKLRRSMIDPMREPLEGVVEIDQAEIPFREGDAFFEPGAAGKILVIGAVEVIDRDTNKAKPRRKHAKYLDTRSGRIRLAAIKDNSAASIQAFVKANVKAGATLLTDGHASYLALSGYRHDPRVVGKMAGHGAVRTDPTGKLLIVLGAGSERQFALDTVRSFDVDWLQGQSVGMYPVKNSTPEPVVSELEKIMDTGDAGLGHGLVKLEAVARLNAILVVAAKPEPLRTAERWISRLDEPSAASASVKVYKVRYGDAKHIAEMLTQIFVASPGSAESPTNEIAPSSGVKELTTEQRLTGGKPPDSNAPTPAGTAAAAAGQHGAAGQFGGVPVATLNAELGALGFGQGGTGGPQMADVRITADPANNSVLIYANADEYKIIERTLNQLDRPRMQVAIEVTIAEVTLNDQLNYGVQFFLSNGALSNTLNGQIPSQVNNYSATPLGPPVSGGLNAIVGNGVLPRVVINALHSLTDVRILSNPSLVVVDNGEATLEVGDQVPVSTGSATVLSANNAVVNTVDYKNTGIILHVQPQVNSNGSVLLNIDQEISAVQPVNGGSANSQNLTPTISQRKVSSEISVVSGQTVLLAGLIQDQQDKSRQGIPMLNQLPYVGAAFGTTGTSQVRTELIIFIRPQIIRDGVDASMVAEELRAKMRGGKVQAVTPAALNVNARPAQ